MLGDTIDSVTKKPSTPTTTSDRLDINLPDGAASQTTLEAILSALSPGANVHSTSLEKSRVISAEACTLRKIVATNTDVADRYLLLFNLTSLPVNGTVPDRDPIPVPAGSPQGWESIQGSFFSTGCVAALSSTMAVLTLVASNVALFNAEKV